MATFVSRKQVTTLKPEVRVDPGLPEGEYLFRLVIVGSNDKMSDPVFIPVKIGPQRTPGRGSLPFGETASGAAPGTTAITTASADSGIKKASVNKRNSKKRLAKVAAKKVAAKKVAVKKVAVKKVANISVTRKRAAIKKTVGRRNKGTKKQ